MNRSKPMDIPGPTDLRVVWHAESTDVVVVRVTGPLDSATASDFEVRLVALFRPLPACLLLDLGGVDYLSSMGLSVILKTALRLKDAGSKFWIYDPHLPVRRVLEISKWGHVVLDPQTLSAESPFFGYICDEEPGRQARRGHASPVPPRLYQD